MTEAFERLAAVAIGEYEQVVVLAVRREEAEHGPRLQPLFLDDAVEQSARIGEQVARRLADGRVAQDARELAVKLPGVEERHPVDVFSQHREVDAVVHANSRRRGFRRCVRLPVDRVPAIARLFDR